MMKSTAQALILSAFLAVSLTSCKDQEMQDITVTPDGPTLVDGKLKFNSLMSFQSYMKANQTKTIEQLIQANQAMGFVSHLRLDSELGLEAPKPVYPSTLHCLNDKQQPNIKSAAGTIKSVATGAKTNAVGFADEPVGDIASDFVSTAIVDPLFDSVLVVCQLNLGGHS